MTSPSPLDSSIAPLAPLKEEMQTQDSVHLIASEAGQVQEDAPPENHIVDANKKVDASGVPPGEWGGLSPKEAWWAGYRVGKGLPPNMPRSEAAAAVGGGQQVHPCGRENILDWFDRFADVTSDGYWTQDSEQAATQLIEALEDELREHGAALPQAWISIKDARPECDGERVFVGVNSAGHAGAFNSIAGYESIECLYDTPEECINVMSDLRLWQEVHMPTREEVTGDCGQQPSPVMGEAIENARPLRCEERAAPLASSRSNEQTTRGGSIARGDESGEAGSTVPHGVLDPDEALRAGLSGVAFSRATRLCFDCHAKCADVSASRCTLCPNKAAHGVAMFCGKQIGKLFKCNKERGHEGECQYRSGSD